MNTGNVSDIGTDCFSLRSIVSNTRKENVDEKCNYYFIYSNLNRKQNVTTELFNTI